MHTQDIAYEADGVRMVGYLTVPDADGEGFEPRPGVLVCHEGPGIGEHAKARARRLAELGYVAFAMDYHGGGKALPMEEARKSLAIWRADPAGIRARAAAALNILIDRPEVDATQLAAIGYCFGGTTALELARSGADLKAVVGFHSGLGTARPQDAGQIRCPVLVCIGADDPLIPPQQRADFEAEMTAGKVDWRVNLYGGAGHSFTNPDADAYNMPGIKYHGPTDRRSWTAMLDLFAETMDQPGG